MSSEQQTSFPSNPVGYAHLPEDETSVSEQQVQGRPIEIGQGTPVIVQGTPAVAMSYPAPMGNFDIHNPAPSQLYKLESGAYICYKYWIVANIVIEGLTFISSVFGNHDYVSHITGLILFYYLLIGWNIYQLGLVYIGIRDKSLERMNKALYLMKIYMIMLAIFYLILTFDGYGQLLDQIMTLNGGETSFSQNIVAIIIGVLITIGCILGIYFGLIVLPAMKVRDILKTAPNGNIGQPNCMPYNNA